MESNAIMQLKIQNLEETVFKAKFLHPDCRIGSRRVRIFYKIESPNSEIINFGERNDTYETASSLELLRSVKS